MAFFYDTTAEATDLWSKTFGPYAFDSTGAIADLATYNGRPIGFSLETQTRPLYSDVRNSTTIAHELAHQWFGDALSVRALERHLAQRELRDVRAVAVEREARRARASATRRAGLRRATRPPTRGGTS